MTEASPIGGELPSFPWPPPRPSARQTLDASLFAGIENFGGVDDRLAAAMQTAGYLQRGYYRVPGGFAIVARLERIDVDGYPRSPENQRFLQPSVDEANNPLSFIHNLFFAPQGRYRQIVFVITDKSFQASAPAPTAEEAAALLENGADALPESYRRMNMTAQHRVVALIYEFRKQGSNARARVNFPADHPASRHLQRSGLMRALTQ